MATVTGVSPLVETSNATIGTVIENRRIVELPLNGRNYLQLVALEPERQRRVRRRRSGGRPPGRHARQPAAVDFRAAPRIQLLHARRRRQHRRQLQHLHLPAVGRRARRIQGADRRLLRRIRARGEPGERGHEIGLEQPARHGVRIPPRRCAGRQAVRLHRRAGRRPEGAVQMGSVRLHGRRPGLEEPPVLHVEFRRLPGSETVPEPLQRAVRGDAERQLLGAAGKPRGHQPADGTTSRRCIVDPTQCTVVGTTRTCAPFPGNIIPAEPHQRAPPSSCSSSIRSPTTAPAASSNNYLVAAGSRDRQVPVHAADGLRPELRVDLDGPLQLRAKRTR